MARTVRGNSRVSRETKLASQTRRATRNQRAAALRIARKDA